jgi:protein ImuB
VLDAPELSPPFALIATERGVRRLYAVDEAALGLGLYVGQKATDAMALVPELATAEADPQGDLASLGALAHWCVRFSPAVAIDPPEGLLIDITGVAHLWDGEAAMLDDLLTRLARHGIPARAAVAGSPGAAWALARCGDDRTTVPPGEEAEALAALPVTALRLEPQTAAQLVRLGLARIGQLAALPRAQLARRFGAAVLTRLDQALARAEEALVFSRPPTPWFARLAFAEPISAPEDLARASADIAARLCARLAAEGQGAGRFELAFHRLDGRAERLTIGLSLPGRGAAAIARLFAPMLETVDPGFGIEVVTLACDRVEPLPERQIGLEAIGEIAREDGIAPLVDRLVNRLGEERVWRAEPFASHIPERAVVRRPPLAPVAPPSPAEEGWGKDRPRPVRLFARPEPIEAIARVPDDPPVTFRWRGQTRRVKRAEGPERLAEEWWRRPPGEAEPSHVRDYYRVEDDTGARYWLFRAGLYGAGEMPKWWLHGLG